MGGSSLTKYPSLIKEWHPIKNDSLKLNDFTSGSNKKVWWKCKKGDDHEWEATISHRTAGKGCPYCSGKKTSKTNNLAYLNPNVAKEWHPTKNGELKPQDVRSHSNKKVWWECKKGDDHEWEATIGSRTQGRGCPYCARKKASKTNNLAYVNPELAQEWHPSKNSGLKPINYTPSSNKKVWWKCKKGDDHEWETTIGSRTQGRGCPYCARKKASKTYNLAYVNPELAQEWHPSKNDDSKPSDFTPGSPKKVWWKCEKGDDHEWEAKIAGRTRGKGCPKCNKKGSSYPEYAICYFLMKNKIKFMHRYKSEFGEIDIYLPEFNLAIEYNGEYFHKNKRIRDEKKYLKMSQKYKLLLINENELKGYDRLNKIGLKYNIIQIYDKKSYKKSYDYVKEIFFTLGIKSKIEINKSEHTNILITMQDLEEKRSLYYNKSLLKEWNYKKNTGINPKFFSLGSNEKVWWKCEKGDDHEWETTIFSRTQGSGCPYCTRQKASKTTNLAYINPELVQEWHPSKNDGLKPSDFIPGSHKAVWWKCEKGDDHEWKAEIRSRAKGSGCPYCARKKASKTYNLAYINPKLAQEWHPSKNDGSKPSHFTPGSTKKVWWKCEKGDDHEWKAKIDSRTQGSGCPYCAGKKASKTYNLACVNPKLAQEWHSSKNDGSKPSDFTPSSNKKVWWKCKKEDDHEWEALIRGRAQGNGCPYCARKKHQKHTI